MSVLPEDSGKRREPIWISPPPGWRSDSSRGCGPTISSTAGSDLALASAGRGLAALRHAAAQSPQILAGEARACQRQNAAVLIGHMTALRPGECAGRAGEFLRVFERTLSRNALQSGNHDGGNTLILGVLATELQ